MFFLKPHGFSSGSGETALQIGAAAVSLAQALCEGCRAVDASGRQREAPSISGYKTCPYEPVRFDQCATCAPRTLCGKIGEALGPERG